MVYSYDHRNIHASHLAGPTQFTDQPGRMRMLPGLMHAVTKGHVFALICLRISTAELADVWRVWQVEIIRPYSQQRPTRTSLSCFLGLFDAMRCFMWHKDQKSVCAPPLAIVMGHYPDFWTLNTPVSCKQPLDTNRPLPMESCDIDA